MAKLISVETALETIFAAISKQPILTLPLTEANGHVLAQTQYAKLTLPPLDASAMDGYALKLEPHHTQGSMLKLIGEAPAGAPYDGQVGTDECVRIFTGGAVPKGANHVIMQENISADGTNITLTEPISPSSHIRKAGIDFNTNDQLVTAGTRLDAYALALLAAANHKDVPVYKRPRVALIANGDELREPGSDMQTGQIISSNPYGLAPLITEWGGEPIFTGISKDDPDAIRAHIKNYANVDILVPIGGASVGDRDYMKPVFESLGYTPHFSKVAVKPGKPTWFGMLNDQSVLGLPGNPASAIVCAHIFLKPLIMALTGNKQQANTVVKAASTQDLPANTWRTGYTRAHAKIDKNGQISVTPYPRQDSSLLTPFLSANCFLVRPIDAPEIKAGDCIDIVMIKPLI
ncbi:MAG: molybdopterin molybdenumtransferase MoeA [Robiginitomaculum sp.]|nr:MAG: molybdopterin molybdenumtransferase MoeA [Robiginitomaculum sp.]